MKKLPLIITSFLCTSCASIYSIKPDSNSTTNASDNDLIKVLIVDGQNNHSVWPKSTVMMKQYMEESGLFVVDVYRTKPTWNGDKQPEYYDVHSDTTHFSVNTPKVDVNFSPEFSYYDVVVSNLGYKAASWPNSTKISFESYMKTGGGLVSVHASDNAFPGWLAYNQMIGLGGWGGRNEKDGPYLYYNNEGVLVKETKPGKGGTHGNRHELKITKRNEHPILKGLPPIWMHTKDECYGRLRGPAENLTVLATAMCPTEERGTGKHEPILMTINYGNGRVFHTTLGHEDYSFESVGFITTFLRGVEWAATGDVTQVIPSDFPTDNLSSRREFTLN